MNADVRTAVRASITPLRRSASLSLLLTVQLDSILMLQENVSLALLHQDRADVLCVKVLLRLIVYLAIGNSSSLLRQRIVSLAQITVMSAPPVNVVISVLQAVLPILNKLVRISRRNAFHSVHRGRFPLWLQWFT